MRSDRFYDASVKKVIILFTDGRSTDTNDLLLSAKYARSNGITIFAVGAGGYVMEELQIIANGQINNNERVITVSNFARLNTTVDILKQGICAIQAPFIVSRYTCTTSSLEVQWKTTTFKSVFSYRLQIQDLRTKEIKKTSVQLLMKKEPTIKIHEENTSSKFACVTTTNLYISSNYEIVVEQISAKTNNQIKTISKVLHNANGKTIMRLTLLDFV
ncbi:uncharacterized protein LOC144422911 [Styela clava]